MPDTGQPTQASYVAWPSFEVDGSSQPSLRDALISLEVRDDVRGPARLEARFENWGRPAGGGNPGFMFFDGGVIAFGKRLVVSLGPSNSPTSAFDGRITALAGDFGTSSLPEVRVHAEDSLQFLRMTRRTRTYENMTDAQAAQQIAQAHNLTPDADASGPQHKVLVQLGQTDLAFLRERAAAIDALCWVEGDKLLFKAHADRDGGQFTLTLGQDLTRFQATADLVDQVTSVEAHGYDVSAKSDPDGQGDNSTLQNEANGAKLGSDILRQAFGERVEHVVDQALATSDEAQAYATAKLNARGRAFVRARGETLGTAALRVGSRVQVAGVGPVFEGTYFVTQVTQRFDRIHGFSTAFEAERPAVGAEQ
jgi:phage protein D